jgi:predicted metalloprotease with PDZ domain
MVTVGDRSDDETWDLAAPEAFHWIGGGNDFVKLHMGRGRLGVKVADLNEGLAPYFGVEAGGGVLVLDVVEESAARKMGIEAGDVIVTVQGEKIGSTEDLTEAVAEFETGEKMDIGVVRTKKELTLHGEAGENLADHYIKAFRFAPDKHLSKAEKFDARGIPDVEMEKIRKEMDDVKRELEKVRQELEKVKESS